MTVANEDALLGMVDQIYASVERPEIWPQTIHAIGALIGGRRHFWGPDETLQPSSIDQMRTANPLEIGCYGSFVLSRADVQTLDQYAQDFGELIIRFLKLVFLSILRSQNDVSAREAIGLKMAQRYLHAFEPSDGASASSEGSVAGRQLIAALWEDGRVFSAENLSNMRLLAPHLDRALRLQTRLSSADVRASILSGALDCLTHGVILVDHSGLPLWRNRRAQEILDTSNGLRLCPTGLMGHRAADTRSLRELIREALSVGRQGLLAISRDDDLRPLLVTAIPLTPVETSDASLAHGVVFISDPDQADDPTVETLRRAFHLTQREAETAIAIAHGHGLQAAADIMGVALTTARSQLQQVFAKTDTSHQAELAAIVHRALTHLRYDMPCVHSGTDGTLVRPRQADTRSSRTRT
jgi:DNA-binding CsgD family transcriptional regulator/PAS domain-containing protein